MWGATAAQKMPNAEAGNGGASSASAQGWGLETFQRGGPSRSLTPREQRQLAFRGKSHPGQGIPGLWPPVRAPDRDRAAPTCPARPPPLSRRRAGYRAPGPGGAPLPRWRAPRGPAAAYSPSRVARGGAGRLRAQLRSARRTGWRRGDSARPGPCPRRGAGLEAGKSACWEAGARAPAWGGEGGRTRLRTRPGSRAGSRQAGGGRAGWRRRKGWGDPAYGRGGWPPTPDSAPARRSRLAAGPGVKGAEE